MCRYADGTVDPATGGGGAIEINCCDSLLKTRESKITNKRATENMEQETETYENAKKRQLGRLSEESLRPCRACVPY